MTNQCAEVAKVLEAIGAVRMTKGGYEWFEFDYDMREVLDAVIASGCIPDHKSHQFYPTPEKLAVGCWSWRRLIQRTQLPRAKRRAGRSG